jgi:translation initiation factor 5A
LIDISDDNFASLLDDDKNETRDDIRIPDGDLLKDIREKFEADESLKITVLKAMGEEQIMGFKVENDKK